MLARTCQDCSGPVQGLGPQIWGGRARDGSGPARDGPVSCCETVGTEPVLARTCQDRLRTGPGPVRASTGWEGSGPARDGPVSCCETVGTEPVLASTGQYWFSTLPEAYLNWAIPARTCQDRPGPVRTGLGPQNTGFWTPFLTTFEQDLRGPVSDIGPYMGIFDHFGPKPVRRWSKSGPLF